MVRAEDLLSENILVPVGRTIEVFVPRLRKIAVMNPHVVAVQANSEKNLVQLTGLAKGRTVLKTIHIDRSERSWKIQVLDQTDLLEQSAQRMANRIPGLLTTRGSRGQVLLLGTVRRAKDYIALKSMLVREPHLGKLLRFSKEVLEYVVVQTQSALIKFGYGGLRFKITTNGYSLWGEVKKKSDIYEVELIAKGIFPYADVDLTHQIDLEDAVVMDIKFLEVQRSSESQWGITWPEALALNREFSVWTQMTGLIHTLIQKGFAKILSNPKLLCKSGVPASFLAGGEVPIRLVSERTASVTFKPYGILLEITAKTDRSKNVSINVSARISDVDASQQIDGLPGFLEQHVKTSVDLKLYETIALAGLFENRNRKSIRKLPFLGQLPILGELFKSRSFQNNESEFFLTLTPTLPDKTIFRQLLDSHRRIQDDIQPSLWD